jgi:hypothetical protein
MALLVVFYDWRQVLALYLVQIQGREAGAVKKRTARSISDISDIVRQARTEWKLKEDEEIWFRGEDAKYQNTTLLPKLYRHLPSDVDIISKNILRKEDFMHAEFSRCGTQLYGHDDVEDWDWYFLMQHHGAPTRLLDWSDGALMGVHFAVREGHEESSGAFVYLVDPNRLNHEIDELPEVKLIAAAWKNYRKHRMKRDKTWPREWEDVYVPGMHSLSDRKTQKPALPKAPLVLEFPQITRRVAAQRSRFIAYGSDKTWLARWAEKDSSRLWRIFIPKSRAPLIRTQLRDAGLTESVIFPDLDGLGRELGQLWDTLKSRRALAK